MSKNFTFSENVKMHPWVGSNYSDSSLKILILGESLYGGHASKNKIINQVEGIRNEDWTHAYFTKIKNIFNFDCKTYSNSMDKQFFWNSAVIMNTQLMQ